MELCRAWRVLRTFLVCMVLAGLGQGMVCRAQDEPWTDGELQGLAFLKRFKDVVINANNLWRLGARDAAKQETKNAGKIKFAAPGTSFVGDEEMGERPAPRTLLNSLKYQGLGALLHLVGNKLFYKRGCQGVEHARPMDDLLATQQGAFRGMSNFFTRAGTAGAAFAFSAVGVIAAEKGQNMVDGITIKAGSGADKNIKRLTDTIFVDVSPRKLGILPWLKRVKAECTLPISGEKLSGNVAATINSQVFSNVPEIVRPVEATVKVSSASKPEASVSWAHIVGDNTEVRTTVGAENTEKQKNDGSSAPQKRSMAYIQARIDLLRKALPAWMGRARPAVTSVNAKHGIALGGKSDHESSASVCATWDEKTVGKGRPHIQAQVAVAKGSGQSCTASAGIFAWFTKIITPLGSPRIGVQHTFGGDTQLQVQLSKDGGDGMKIIDKNINTVVDPLLQRLLAVDVKSIDIDFGC